MKNLKKLPMYDDTHIKNHLVGVFSKFSYVEWHQLEKFWRDQEKILEFIEKYEDVVTHCNYPQEKRLATKELKTASELFSSLNETLNSILEFRGWWLPAMFGAYRETSQKIEAITENIELIYEFMESIQYSVLVAIIHSQLDYNNLRILVAQWTLEEVNAALQNAKPITQANHRFENTEIDLPEVLDDQETEKVEIAKAVVSSLWDGRERRKYAYWLRAIKKIIKVVNIGEVAKDRAGKLSKILQGELPRSSILEIIQYGQELYEEIVTDPDIINAWIEELEDEN